MEYTPIKDHVLVIVDKEDKYTHQIEGTDIKLFIDKDFGWNEREKNAVNAVVHHPGSCTLKKGTKIVCWHNSFSEHTLVDTIQTEEDSVYGGKKKMYIHAIHPSKIFLWFSDGSPVPMPGFYIVDRIYYKPQSSSIIITEISETKENNRVVVRIAPENDPLGLKDGQVLIVETMSDYEVVYADLGRECRLIRIKENDIIAIDDSFEITEQMRTGV
jgi:co-chaperonin GroES (HSP10)